MGAINHRDREHSERAPALLITLAHPTASPRLMIGHPFTGITAGEVGVNWTADLVLGASLLVRQPS